MHQTISSKCRGAERCYQADVVTCVNDSCLRWLDDLLIRELLLTKRGSRLIVFQFATHSSHDTCSGTTPAAGQGRWHMTMSDTSLTVNLP